MKITQKRVLRSVFSLRGNFTPARPPKKKVFDGIEITPFKNGCSAAASISADFELNWAFRCMAAAERDKLSIAERQNVPYILALLDEFKIPITWATVGHLFLQSCKCDGKLPHTDMPRPPANPRWQGDWYKHDPCSDVQQDPLWYAPDLVKQIVNAKVAHEVGSHSFSHIDFSPQTSDRELVEREMQESLTAVEGFGLKLKSLVYPYNHMGHSYHDLLHQFGIIAVRHRDDKVRLSYPERSPSGVYKIYESMNLRSPSFYDYRDKAEIFIEGAVEAGAAYHLWFHPSDARGTFEKEFREILEVIYRYRDSGNVWVATMGDLAAYCEARESVSLEIKTEADRKTLKLRSSLDTEKYGTPEITLQIAQTAMPKRIERRIGDRVDYPAPDVVCATKHNTVVLNVVAVDQIITMLF